MRRTVIRSLLALAALLALVVGAAVIAVRASLPTLDGRERAAGIGATLRIERDAAGVVTLSGSGRDDLAFGLGYVHGQDRFFQMDLLRRAAAGELSALLGPATLPVDRALRVHRFRAVAQQTLEHVSPEQRALVTAYAAGVNAGLGSLRARPFEYLLLRVAPQPWRPEDMVLVALAMFIDLQQADAHTLIQRGLVREALPEPAARFVLAAASDWEATLDGSVSEPPLAPAAADYDLHSLGGLDFEPPARHARTRPAVGSNNWAVAGSRTASGGAIVANDMHLALRVPNVWYRARLMLAAPGDAAIDVTGVTLPGTPLVIAGSNGHIAWGFTNSYGMYEDVITVVPEPAGGNAAPGAAAGPAAAGPAAAGPAAAATGGAAAAGAGRYLGATGPQPFSRTTERIEVNGAAPESLEVIGTEWGPVIAHDAAGRPLALQWTAHDPRAVNLELLGMERARSVEEALALGPRLGMPAQNLVVGDAAGHIGWTLTGLIPARRGGIAAVPRLSTDPAAGFDGWLAPAQRPRIVDPAAGQIYTANARVIGGEALAPIGDGGYDRGARAGQIGRVLAAAGEHQTPLSSLAVHRDDRALFLERWHGLLAGLLDADAVAAQPRRAELRDALARWSGHAAIDDPAYRLVREFRAEVERRTFYALIAPARARNPGFAFRVPKSFEGPLWTLVTQQPAHLVPPGQPDWRAFLLASADAMLAALVTDCPRLIECTWGRANTTHIQHPLSKAVPRLGPLLDMQSEPLPGDEDMPRVQGVAVGASERFAVSPGREAEGYFDMPGGQSGHPLSPFYRAGHAAWAHVEPAPFLPGPAAHVLTLAP